MSASLYILLFLALLSVPAIRAHYRRREAKHVEAVGRRIDTLWLRYRDGDRSRFRISNPGGGKTQVTVHDRVTGELLTIMPEDGGRAGRWWVLFEEYEPGPSAHLADRKSRVEARFSGGGTFVDRLKSFAECPHMPTPASEVIVDPFEMPADISAKPADVTNGVAAETEK